jgi:hypothetical protein
MLPITLSELLILSRLRVILGLGRILYHQICIVIYINEFQVKLHLTTKIVLVVNWVVTRNDTSGPLDLLYDSY